jgi:hypothetical protein
MLKNLRKKRISVHSHHPVKRLSRYTLYLLISFIIAYSTFYYGGGYFYEHNKVLQSALEREQAYNEDLARKLAEKERVNKIMNVELSQLRGYLVKRDIKINSINDERLFYKNLLAPESRKPKVSIQKIEFLPGNDSNTFSYELVLFQNTRGQKVASGRYDMSIRGKQGDKDKSLKVSNLMKNSKSTLNYRFRYFESLVGSFSLPQGFVPSSLQVDIIPRNAGMESYKMVYTWSNLHTDT